MSVINAVLRALVDWALYPFRDLPAVVGLTVVSLVTAIGLLIIFKHTSNQKALEAVKRQIHACLFEMRLFNDDFRSIFRAQFEILRHNLTYLRYSSVPLLWTLLPLVLLIAQLQFHYGYQGLVVGKPILVKVKLEEGASHEGVKPKLRLEAPAGSVKIQEPAVWVPVLSEMTWRLVPEAIGDYDLQVVNGSESVTKTLQVTDALVRRSPIRVRGFLDELLYPAEPPLPNGAVESITVAYPEVDVSVFGFEFHWMIVYFVLSTVFAFVLRGPFKVTI